MLTIRCGKCSGCNVCIAHSALCNFCVQFWNESVEDHGVKELACPESLLMKKGMLSVVF